MPSPDQDEAIGKAVARVHHDHAWLTVWHLPFNDSYLALPEHVPVPPMARWIADVFYVEKRKVVRIKTKEGSDEIDAREPK